MTNFNSSGMVFFPGNSGFSITMEERWTKFKALFGNSLGATRAAHLGLAIY